MNKIYYNKVDLLLSIIPHIYEEDVLAIHGGTAINLFVTNLPRLSVDVDLTYIPIEERDLSIKHINESLFRISNRIKKTNPDINIISRPDICKLSIENKGIQIKLEVNKTKRGIIEESPIELPLSPKAQEMFETFIKARIVPLSQLYGGKVVAALSRQHPRDLFDIKYMPIKLDRIKKGFIFNLLGSDRPLYESFNPSLIDQQQALKNQFEGMSELRFLYSDFEETRNNLITEVNNLMSDNDKQFLIDFENGCPNWENSEYYDFYKYPAVQWKLNNIHKLKEINPLKLKSNISNLSDIFESKKPVKRKRGIRF